ncbi:TIGR00153 family protein [Motiliproteus sp. MSK22-1]|uniref:TIGR00153 family protein n=1 Tax=Motiliproteus sp. MSK22-1 TaxID=1897630 RepID=UPI00097851DD|nr:TIGR00153 family protein [Motiliproteus sp. MSK22-1]OMH28003.1 TIGR00153 family protein [Motiliproteus sp. MSK22-1]
MVANSSFLQMFARSPVKPMQQHIEKAHACAMELVPFFDAVLAKDWEKAEQIQLRISDLEHQADELKRGVRAHLPKSLFMPVPRTDLLELLRMQDRIANKAKDIAGIMTGRQMEIPDGIASLVTEYVQGSLAVTEQAVRALNELDELVATGFRGREADTVGEMIDELDRLEHEADRREREIRHALFDVEKDLPPIDVMFLYKVIEWIGELADRAQQVGSRLQLLLAR